MPPRLGQPGGGDAAGADAGRHRGATGRGGGRAAAAGAAGLRQGLRQRRAAGAAAVRAGHRAGVPAPPQPQAGAAARPPQAAALQAALEGRADVRLAGKLPPPGGALRALPQDVSRVLPRNLPRYNTEAVMKPLLHKLLASLLDEVEEHRAGEVAPRARLELEERHTLANRVGYVHECPPEIDEAPARRAAD